MYVLMPHVSVAVAAGVVASEVGPLGCFILSEGRGVFKIKKYYLYD